eukprot:jgi/Tetstr1/441823/TSEL_030039.t1
MRGALESLSTESATAESKAAALAELRACYRTHLAMEEATRSRLGYLQLAKQERPSFRRARLRKVLHPKADRRVRATRPTPPSVRRQDPRDLAFWQRARPLPRRQDPRDPAPTESAERRKQREQAAAARKAAATAAATDKAKAKVTK